MAKHPRTPTRATNPFDPLDGRPVDTLDLHGSTADEARARVQSFLKGARQRRPGELVHIITGKGRNSPGRPVLKPAVRTLLRASSAQVAAFDLDDDEGGFLVRLRR